MSRKGIEFGSLTLHPGGLPHGPHPGRVEESIGKKRTDELAVMLDTFRPLQVGQGAGGDRRPRLRPELVSASGEVDVWAK